MINNFDRYFDYRESEFLNHRLVPNHMREPQAVYNAYRKISAGWHQMDDRQILKALHYNDVRMSTVASQITSLTNVYSTVYSDADQRKHQSSASLAFVWGNHRGPVTSPHKWPVTRKMFPFDDVIMRSYRFPSFALRWSIGKYHNHLHKQRRTNWFQSMRSKGDGLWPAAINLTPLCDICAATRLFVQLVVQPNFKENTKAPHYCTLWGSMVTSGFPKRSVMGKPLSRHVVITFQIPFIS